MCLSDKLYGSEVSKEDSMEDGFIAEEQDDTITNKEPEKMPTINFEEDYKELSENSCPNLFQMFRGKDRAPTHVLNALFSELLGLLGTNNKSVDFVYGNGKIVAVLSLCRRQKVNLLSWNTQGNSNG